MEYAQGHLKKLQEKLEKERTPDPVAEEGKELTDEQKLEISKKRQAENALKLKEVEARIAEAPKFTFNANVFKQGATLAMSADELKQEEDKIVELASFLTKEALDILVSDLRSFESTPTDSKSLENYFHRHGVNMRYLGAVYAQLGQVAKIDEAN